MSKGQKRAEGKFQEIVQTHDTPCARYAGLTQTYNQFAGILEANLENFYPDQYFVRSETTAEQREVMMLCAFTVQESLNHLQRCMKQMADEDANLAHMFARQVETHKKTRNNFALAFQVFRTQGEVLKEAPQNTKKPLREIIATGFSFLPHLKSV